MDFGLTGKRALVLGGSRGLGAASADALRAEGVTVLAASRSGDYKVDLADPASVAALIERVRGEGGVDILVNNSGGPKAGPAQGQSSADWLAAFQTMATSLYVITDGLLPQMIERGWGRIITIGSSGVLAPIPGLALSNAVRGAIAGWSKTLAAEVAAQGITVNMVLPGRIDTDRVRELDSGKAQRSGSTLEDVQAASRRDIPLGRYGQPEEFGAVVAFLASRQASFVTGSMLRVDGGMIRGL
ncbi:MAG: SDR family oxidoreductase [Alphaproteobacteria bacterium]|nr:SDR family oxidoreductase [Alphaproteobacteria bacterium]MBU1562325.1 SDR family oxidoreductase [Alphaproteobacteria bacterium]MBU2302703.1 SDR family oxidoreductase [Alphaproteobacteria bacterium]MBU2369272.1 SDR family oxidoreductase [Alphaproteobacteria bacterium]